ncbi:hypothetical protein CQ046_21335 [Chryseobacterium sp. MYb7]|uniref:S8 family serine peptidase n=1 Tax=Chryseobacterium sp. MYb7 TaxID=1827290 RepID=UPI000CFFBB7D|nr:S8 family serine peptidase [Chryseobacterium sp. MYb7]PRA97586.1 hypothetical protein CQ046_21335 [Chryseobacterium sp. MYb7]
MKKRILFSALFTFSASACFFAQTETERREITKKYDQKTLQNLFNDFSEKSKQNKVEAVAYARKNNLPLVIEEKDGSVSELMRIDENGTPIYYSTKNVDAAKSTRANHLNTGGSLGLNLNGENMIVGVWDGGAVRNTHVEFGNRVTRKDNGTFNAVLNSNHATHVAGTIGAAGVRATAKGMASSSQIESYDWTSDAAEMTAAATGGLLLSNHSYGLRSDSVPDWYFGAYIDESSNWDAILFNAPSYLVVKASGNDGLNRYRDAAGVLRILNESPMGGATDLYDKLTASAASKNVLVVANAEDANVDVNGNLINVVINSSSSQGPTDDLRIKPDITGNGTELTSPVAFNGNVASNNTYGIMTGTSMASPNVTGTLSLVQQHHNNVQERYMLGAELKGLALHTADDAGVVGPDAMFGWGLLNAKKMVEVINGKGKNSIIDNKTLNNNATESLIVQSDGINPLTVSISWYDRAGAIQTSNQLNNNAVKRLVNNLDLKVTRKSDNTVYRPWVLTSRSTNAKAENNNDNFERVDLGVVPAGEYVIEISHKGALVGGSQNYTLIVTGKADSGVVTPETPSCIKAYEANETLSTAAAINANETISAAIGSGTDKDFYKFTIGNGNLVAKLNGPIGVDYDLYVYNANGSLLGKSEGATAVESVSLTNVSAGTYYARVIGYNGANSTTCYTLNINANVSKVSSAIADRDIKGTDIGLYPNPADKEINVTNSKDNEAYIIYDLAGKVMQQGQLKESKINVSSLVSGSYLLMIDKKSYKFIKR